MRVWSLIRGVAEFEVESRSERVHNDRGRRIDLSRKDGGGPGETSSL
jgi:hypothetical protein